MLGIYEIRHFHDNEKIWLGRYQNLTNVYHWHTECEIIRIVEGRAQIKIDDTCYAAETGDCFFCCSEQLHYIISDAGTLIDIAILNTGLTQDLIGDHALLSPQLPAHIPVEAFMNRVKTEQAKKEPFYPEAIEITARDLLIHISRSCPMVKKLQTISIYNKLINKINEEYAYITFSDAVRYCGYSPSHFSKMFTRLSGMNFSEYLNIVRIEHAIKQLQQDGGNITAVSMKCGFSTVRNFNRVFKRLTGYSPRTLPNNYTIHTALKVSRNHDFDPTADQAVLI